MKKQEETNSFYLFPEFVNVHLSCEEISKNIAEAKTHINVINNILAEIEAGQTYMGQFIAHEVVPSGRINPNRINNSPGLNLKSLYGDNHDNAYFNATGHFIMGFSGSSSTYGTDLLRNGEGIAMIPEIRNDENIILSQFHLFWQKVHNTIIDHLYEQTQIKINDYFNFAKNIVVLLFHRLVKEDFLKQIVMKEIYNYYFRHGSDRANSYMFANQSLNTIPVEFSRAAFRFAHSMVRSHYQFSSKKDGEANTEEIFKYRNTILPSQFEVDWDFFFQTDRFHYSYLSCANNDAFLQLLELDASGKMIGTEERNTADTESEKGLNTDFQMALAIDTNIVEAMTKLPSDNGKKDDNKKNVPQKPNSEIDIREVDLEIAHKSRMATGVEIFDQLRKVIDLENIVDLDYLKNTVNSQIQESFKDLDYIPLWLYILKEAEVTGCNRPCKNLGCVGSFIVLETLLESIAVGKAMLVDLNKKRVDQFIENNIFKGNSTRFGHLLNYLKKRGTI